MRTKTRAHRTRLLRGGMVRGKMVRGGMVLGAIAGLLLTGCAADVPKESSDSTDVAEQPTQTKDNAGGGLTAEAIIAAVEPEGLECLETEPQLDGTAQVIVCKGDNYVTIQKVPKVA